MMTMNLKQGYKGITAAAGRLWLLVIKIEDL